MIIDDLPSISIANDSDEIAIEQGTATKKITKANLLKEINSDVDDLETIVGDGQLSGFTATDLTGAANELKSNLTQNKPLHLTKTLTAGTGNQSFTVSGITSTMYLINAVFGTPANVLSNITWTTAANTITFNGTIGTGGTTVTFDLIEGRTS